MTTKTDYVCKKSGFVRQLEELTGSVQLMFKSIFEAFLQHKKSSLELAEENGRKSEGLIKEIMKNLLASGNQEEVPDRIVALELLKSLDQIKYGATKLNDTVSNKITDGVLFSDKAVTELRDVFAVVIECLTNITDLVVTGNEVIAKHLINRAQLYSEVIKEYAAEHEVRLIEGICMPKSSIIYLTMLDALKDVLWNLKVIGEAFRR